MKKTFFPAILSLAFLSLLRDQLKALVFLAFLFLLPFAAKAQTPTCFTAQYSATPTYIYIGSITKNSGDGSNFQKLKLDVFGGSWVSSSVGQTTFYMANRGGLVINKVTTGGAPIDGYFDLKVYQNGNQTDFYLVSPPFNYAGASVLSLWLKDGTSVFVTPTSSSSLPAGTQILPLNVTNVMTTDAAGNIGINTPNTFPQYQFAVNGAFIATSATVKLYSNWPDYVFKKDYQLPSLQEVKAYIDQNQHLPEIPSEQEIAKDGLNLGEMNKLLMKKVEELTLYLIEKDQQLKAQEKINKQVEERMQALEERLNTRKKTN